MTAPTADEMVAIRARANAATQAAANGTTGEPPNVDGLSVDEACNIFADSAADVPLLLNEVERLRAQVAAVHDVRERVANKRQWLTEGPLIGRLLVLEWLDAALSEAGTQ